MTPGTALDREGRLWTLSPCPYCEIGLFWDGRRHRGTILDHSHSIVNRRARLIGRSGALAGRSERDTAIRTVAFLAIVELRSHPSRSACRYVRSAWDRLGSKSASLTVSIGLFCDAVTVLAGPMTVSRLRLPAARKVRARVSGSRLQAGGARPARRRGSCLRPRTAPGSQIVRKE